MALYAFIGLFLSLALIFLLVTLIILIFIDGYKEHQESKKFRKIYSELKYYKFYKTKYLFSNDDKSDNCIYFDLEFETVRLAKNEFIINYDFPSSFIFDIITKPYWHCRFEKWFKKNIDFKNIPLHSYDSN